MTLRRDSVTDSRVVVFRNFIRVTALAVGLSTLSFAAGVAGDLSLADPPNYGQRVVLRLPPELPADSVRAAPLLSTASAEAAITPQRQRHVRFAPLTARTVRADYLVYDEAGLSMVRLPKMRSFWAAKPAERLALA